MPEIDEKNLNLDGPEDEDGDEVGASPSKDGEKRKAGRPPLLYKKYQARIDKLVEKQDAEYVHYLFELGALLNYVLLVGATTTRTFLWILCPKKTIQTITRLSRSLRRLI